MTETEKRSDSPNYHDSVVVVSQLEPFCVFIAAPKKTQHANHFTNFMQTVHTTSERQQKYHARLLTAYALQDHTQVDLLSLMVFTHLPTEYIERIVAFTEDDWMNYNGLRELEVFGNRPDNQDPREQHSETLPVDLFTRWNKTPTLSYALYAAMSEAEHIPNDVFYRRVASICEPVSPSASY